ncbi:MAG: sensor histidine kinase [Hydrogenophaga sp.]|nr:sensor histidine kinase [Hydrogenophaga sp.]
MPLHTFITRNLDAILVDWVAFARELQPAGAHLDEVALLDHGRQILTEIAADMQRPQSDTEQQDKSEGHSLHATDSPHVPSRSHARQRKRQGFDIEELVAEYRALRATVLRLWSQSTDDIKGTDLESVTRFNEAVDQAIAESLETFMAELDKSRDLFLGVLGHDLRGPLGTIANVATFQMRARPEDAKQAGILLRSVSQMRVLLDDLVEYARHRHGSGFDIETKALDLGDFTRNTLDEIAAIRNERVIHLDSQGDLDGEWDARRLHQALSNLIFNALKYGEADAPIFITLDGTSPDEVELSVQNTGEPIPPTALAKLFDPFVRGGAEDVSSQTLWSAGASLGLGLYVVQEITKAHGGTVEVVSNETFTRFSIHLPRRRLADPD